MKNLKLSLLALLTCIIGIKQAEACHGMPLQNYLVTVGAAGVTVTANSDPSTCGCGPYWLQTEISCTPVFVGSQPACMTSTLTNWNNPATSYLNYPYYNSLLNVPNYNIANGWPDNCALEPYHPNVIPFSNLCPGKTYYIRSREMVLGGSNTGPWTPVQSFVVPGSAVVNPPNTLNMTLNANPNPIVCCGPVQLTAIITGTNYGQCIGNAPSCEKNVTVTPTFSWTSSNPVSTTIGNGNTFTTTINVLSVTNLTSTTTFSVWLAYMCSSPSGTVVYTPSNVPIIFTNFPLSSANATNTFVTAASNAVWTQALSSCLSGGICMCQFLNAQPAVVTVNVLSVPPPLTVIMTPNTCLSSPNFTFTDISANANNFNLFWNFGDGGTGTGTNVAHTYTAAGIYTVTVNKAGCGPCSAYGSYTVQVYPSPNSVLSVNSPVCIGGTASFSNTVTNGATYSWTGPNSYTSSLQNPVITNVTAAMAGIYTCVTTNSNGCTGTSTVSLTTNQATLSAGANNPVCPGSPINLTATGSGNYSWTGPNNFLSAQHSPSLTAANNSGGSYIVTATLTGNCYASATVAVNISTTSVSASNNGPACSGNNIQLHAFGNGTFVWSGPNGFTSNSQNPVINNATSIASGVYTVTITSPQGCTATATTNVVVNGARVLHPSASPAELCEGGTINFEALDGSGTSYLWTGPNGFTSNKANVGILDATPLNTGIYILTLTDPAGCIATGSASVKVNPKPNIDIDMSKAKPGCAPLCNIEFKSITNSSALDLSWKFGNGDVDQTVNPKNICYTAAQVYTVELNAVDAKGCTANIAKTLETYPVPVADFVINNNGATWVNGATQFTDKSTKANIQAWLWTFGSPDNTSTVQNPNYTYQDSGKYNVTLEVTSDRGCRSSVSKKVIVADEMGVFIPNAFSPNGDGSNDVFLAVSNSVTKFEMLIFNRGGSLIFQSNDIRKGWDGNVKGEIAENNVYVYKVSYVGKDNKSHSLTGSVTLVR
ncbi:MAG: PKD domain-containing protein [Bacteroidetes bacterium]|nr:PKD domain-containing protein [Bacteroidota bacterium]